jgi:hypothetical protein
MQDIERICIQASDPFTAIPNDATDDMRLTAHDLTTYMALKRWYFRAPRDRDHRLTSIARIARLSVSSTRRAIAHLIECGWIEKQTQINKATGHRIEDLFSLNFHLSAAYLAEHPECSQAIEATETPSAPDAPPSRVSTEDRQSVPTEHTECSQGTRSLKNFKENKQQTSEKSLFDVELILEDLVSESKLEITYNSIDSLLQTLQKTDERLSTAKYLKWTWKTNREQLDKARSKEGLYMVIVNSKANRDKYIASLRDTKKDFLASIPKCPVCGSSMPGGVYCKACTYNAGLEEWLPEIKAVYAKAPSSDTMEPFHQRMNDAMASAMSGWNQKVALTA